MKGDFSRLRFPGPNINGILPQQGRVLLDSDGIAQTLVENAWRQTAARDLLGAGASVAADAADSFAITAATSTGNAVALTVNAGHLWADGLLVEMESPTGSLTREASWLTPPLVPLKVGTVNGGDRDAVVLEVWQQALSAFQVPNALLEPALGGPDTAERLQTSFAFRLARLDAGEGCDSLTYDESGRGALTVALVPLVPINGGDCPVQGAGGYSGYEHQLYRIEVANSDAAASQFKWSRSNAGLAGRGNFTPGPNPQIGLTANLAAITSARQTSFYLEIEAYDAGFGYSRVVCAGWVTLAGSILQCGAVEYGTNWPAAAGPVFFRLWDGFEPIGNYIAAGGTLLENGILLQFDPDAPPGKYYPGDYWTFPVRAQGIANPQTLINAKQPQGIVYQRVALAEITWAATGGTFTGTIEDCRTIVPPLSRAKGCCTFRVGNGVTSFGDFNTIQDAVDQLPPQGGEICLLPGLHRGPVRIIGKRDVMIHGCGWQTRVASPARKIQTGKTPTLNPLVAVFTIVNSVHVKLASFAIEAADTETGVLIGGGAVPQARQTEPRAASAIIVQQGTIDVTLEDLVITAALLPAVLALNVELLRITRNRVAMKNSRLEDVLPFQWPAIFVAGQEIHIERNWIGLQTAAAVREYLPITVQADLAGAGGGTMNVNAGTGLPLHPGGIQIGGPSSDVYILENEIDSGSRNGITLGSLLLLDDKGNDTGTVTGTGGEGEDCCPPTLIPPDGGDGGGRYVSAGVLVNIQIHRNRIRDMGLCGIGPVGFFDPQKVLEIISIINLHISQNEISRTLQRVPGVIPNRGITWIGYGAVCVPDVRDLVIHDNAITDFGAQPGDNVCGIFVLHGELIDISRNQVVETRDWRSVTKNAQPNAGPRGGIFVAAVTPPSAAEPLITASWGSTTAPVAPVVSSSTYAPGMPALRIAENVVRVPENYSLLVFGWGAFEIPDNHFACGGQVSTAEVPLAQTVLIFNLGTPIDRPTKAQLPGGTLGGRPTTSGNTAGIASIAAGTVLFNDNVCQLEARRSEQHARSSILIFTLDQLTFSSNHSWVEGLRSTAIMDALLIGETLNVVGNRFQEAPLSVIASALTYGAVNITGQNISSHLLAAVGTLAAATNNNLVVP